jgi:hypothetical protein
MSTEEIEKQFLNLESGLHLCAVRIQEGRAEEAKRSFVGLVDDLDGAIKNIGRFAEALGIDIGGIAPVLTSVNGALAAADDSLLADLLEHELLPIIASWRSAFQSLAAQSRT